MSSPLRNRPTGTEYFGYQFGRTLPDSLQEWVRNDLVGPGATTRYLVRFLIPAIPLLSLFLLVPGPMWIRLAMIALLLFPFVYFAFALMNVYRRHRLLSHGLDPELIDEKAQRRVDAVRDDYERRHGRS